MAIGVRLLMAFIILQPYSSAEILFSFYYEYLTPVLFQVLMWWTGFITMWRASRIGEKRENMPATSLKLDTSATPSIKSLSLSSATIFLEIFVAVCIILQLLCSCTTTISITVLSCVHSLSHTKT